MSAISTSFTMELEKIFKDEMKETNNRLDLVAENVAFLIKNAVTKDYLDQRLKTELDPIRYDISGLNSKVSTLEYNVSTLTSDVSTLKSDVSILKSDMSIVKNELQGISKKLDVVGWHEVRIKQLEDKVN